MHGTVRRWRAEWQSDSEVRSLVCGSYAGGQWVGGAGGGFGRLTHLLDDFLEDVDWQVQQPQRASGPVLALVLGCGGSGWVAVDAVIAVVALGVPRVLLGQGRAMFVVVGRVVVGQRGRGCAGGHGIRVHGGLRNMCAGT